MMKCVSNSQGTPSERSVPREPCECMRRVSTTAYVTRARVTSLLCVWPIFIFCFGLLGKGASINHIESSKPIYPREHRGEGPLRPGTRLTHRSTPGTYCSRFLPGSSTGTSTFQRARRDQCRRTSPCSARQVTRQGSGSMSCLARRWTARMQFVPA
jgi:hypothetical protein